MKYLKQIFIIFFCFLSLNLTAQHSEKDSVKAVFTAYDTFIKGGRLKEAVKCLSGLLSSNTQLSLTTKLAINNNLGIQYKNLGQYEMALRYYDKAESIYLNNNFPENSFLIRIYGNKVNIYLLQGDFHKALDYCEKAIRIVTESSQEEVSKQQSISSLYLNTGIANYHLNNFKEALWAFQKSTYLKNKYNLPGKDILYKQLAITYAKIGNKLLADKYFNLSIRHSESGDRSSSISLANVYLDYGIFLMSIKENDRAISALQKALNINLNSMGEKNYLTSNCYQIIGDYFYWVIKDYSKALIYYQKTLVSGSKDFNNFDINANPSLKEITVNLWQLRVLQAKADALALLADKEQDKEKKINFLILSVNTNSLAIEMTNQIRVDYQDEETRLTFNEKQKNVFTESIETALKLYNLTSEKKFLQLAYQTVQQSKANELRYEISRNESFSNKEISDSLRYKEKEIQSNISAYNALIRNESSILKPDTVKLAYWKDQLFILNRALEKSLETIDRDYPRFTDLLKRGKIVELKTIQSNLKPDESLIEYLYSDAEGLGERKLYEFVVTPKDLFCHTELVDSTLSANLTGLRAQLTNQLTEEKGITNYNKMNKRLFRAYSVLIQPLEKYIQGKQLVIIPDEGLSYLPFDAFLTSWMPKTKINYAELDYLIKKYSISYGYSTNTLWKNSSIPELWSKVIGFAPDYSDNTSEDRRSFKSLKNNNREIESILNNFNGISFSDGQATLANFTSKMSSGAILHLAMHSDLDTVYAGTSSLIFNTDNSQQKNYRLYNYEIGQMNIKSPMVVLSACNTGNGKLYSGEGLMSLARSFILAGVPSVVETLWPVEDIAGSKIMGDFYKYLSDGKPKNTALRLAKLDYINNTSPSFVNPRYWAAYTLVGDVTPIKKKLWKEPWIILSTALLSLILIAFFAYRLRFLRIN